VRLESTIEQIHAAGGEVIAISVNEEERQAGMAGRWKLDHIKMVSDPGGDNYLKAIDAFDPDERGGIATPAIVVIAPDGAEAYRYNGRDFADRTTDEEVMAALAGLGLDPVDPGTLEPSMAVSDDLKGFFSVANYGPYFMGNRFGAIAIGGRVTDPEAKMAARQHRLMADASLEAWKQLNN
jgi:hypothetical protein